MKNTKKNAARAIPLMAITGMGALVGMHSPTVEAPKPEVSISQETRSEAIPMALIRESTSAPCAPGEKEKVAQEGKNGVRKITTKVSREDGREIAREKVSENIALAPQAKRVKKCTPVSRSEQRSHLPAIEPGALQGVLSTTKLSPRPGAPLTAAEAKQLREEKEKATKKVAPSTKVETPAASTKAPEPVKKVEKSPTATPQAQVKKSSPSKASTPAATATATPTPTATPVRGSKEDWMQQAGIAPQDYAAVDYIIFHESGWNYRAVNPSSGAYGLCQALPGIKLASAGADWATNPITQLKWCSNYSTSRYGGWANSLAAWQSKHWW